MAGQRWASHTPTRQRPLSTATLFQAYSTGFSSSHTNGRGRGLLLLPRRTGPEEEHPCRVQHPWTRADPGPEHGQGHRRPGPVSQSQVVNIQANKAVILTTGGFEFDASDEVELPQVLSLPLRRLAVQHRRRDQDGHEGRGRSLAHEHDLGPLFAVDPNLQHGLGAAPREQRLDLDRQVRQPVRQRDRPSEPQHVAGRGRLELHLWPVLQLPAMLIFDSSSINPAGRRRRRSPACTSNPRGPDDSRTDHHHLDFDTSTVTPARLRHRHQPAPGPARRHRSSGLCRLHRLGSWNPLEQQQRGRDSGGMGHTGRRPAHARR